MELIALALAPGLAICLFIFYKDIYNREPRLNLVLSFVFGCLSIIPAVIAELSFKLPEKSIATAFLFAYVLVALSEEGAKFAVLRVYAYPKRSFDEPLDGIVYSVMISMGFATLENVLYVLQYAEKGMGLQVALQRMFLSVPAHASFAVVMGYFVGKAKFSRGNRTGLLLAGLLGATFFHGTFDFFLFLPEYGNISDQAAQGLLAGGAIASFVVCIILSRKLIKQHKKTSQQLFKPVKDALSIRSASEKDIELIRTLTYQVWPQTYAGLLSQEQIDYMLQLMYSKQSLEKQMRDGARFLLVYDGKEPVGFASWQEMSRGVFKLHKLYVLPSQQGKGTGRFIIEHISAAAATLGGHVLELQVNRNNTAKQFYERNGFTVAREAKIDIGNGFVMDDFIMQKTLG